MSILDEIVLLAPEFRVLEALDSLEPLDSLAPPSSMGPHAIEPSPNSEPARQLPLPFVLRETSQEQVGTRWNELCGLLKSYGLAIQCPAAQLQGVPGNSVPIRMAKQSIDESFLAGEFQSADIIVLSLRSVRLDSWAFPPELGSEANLPHWIEAVRQACRATKPIAIELPMGVDTKTLEKVVAAPIDILSLVADSNMPDEIIVESLVRARSILRSHSQSDLPIQVQSRHSQPDHLIKLLGLGGSVVAIDGVLNELWAESPDLPRGFLSKVESRVNEKSECPIHRKIRLLNQAFFSAIDLRCSSPLENLGQRLRALSDRAEKIAQIPFLGS